MTADTMLKVRLGLVIRQRRERLRMTQEEFADSIGMHTPYYGQIERGRQNITLWNLQRVATGLRTSASKLLRAAEHLNLPNALLKPHRPPRVGRPPGRRSGY
jgi:transcriptional regulator with XRE-family HTH domain